MTKEEAAHKILSLLGGFHTNWNVQEIVKILEGLNINI